MAVQPGYNERLVRQEEKSARQEERSNHHDRQFDTLVNVINQLDEKLDKVLDSMAERRGAERQNKIIGHALAVTAGGMGSFLMNAIHFFPK